MNRRDLLVGTTMGAVIALGGAAVGHAVAHAAVDTTRHDVGPPAVGFMRPRRVTSKRRARPIEV